jgi:hypothetical protein
MCNNQLSQVLNDVMDNLANTTANIRVVRTQAESSGQAHILETCSREPETFQATGCTLDIVRNLLRLFSAWAYRIFLLEFALNFCRASFVKIAM